MGKQYIYMGNVRIHQTIIMDQDNRNKHDHKTEGDPQQTSQTKEETNTKYPYPYVNPLIERISIAQANRLLSVS